MPELPEVEAARRAIEEHCLGKKIVKSIIANDSKVIDGVSPSDFEASILNKTIVAAHRKGKNMWLQLDSPPFPSFQFGMAGAIYIKGVAVTKYKRSAVNDSDDWPSKYSMFFVKLNDGLELSFTDKRRFAKVRLLNDPTSVLPISELGPDALLEPMTVDELHKSLSKKKTGIKALLLDQSFISGIGNWIADEVLYQARIHPSEISCNLSKEKCTTLHKCIKEVIQFAVQVDADCSHFPIDWLFHSRWGKKPGQIHGRAIEFINAGGRTTAYVPELQKLSGGQASKAPAKTTKRASKRNNETADKDEDDDTGELENGKRTARNPSRRNKSARTNENKGKKTTAKKKSNESSDDADNDHDVDTDKKQSDAPGNWVPAKRKSQEKPDGNGNKATVQKKKSRGQSQMATAKSASKEMNSDIEGDGSSDNDDTGDENEPTEVAKGKTRAVDHETKKKGAADGAKQRKKVK